MKTEQDDALNASEMKLVVNIGDEDFPYKIEMENIIIKTEDSLSDSDVDFVQETDEDYHVSDGEDREQSTSGQEEEEIEYLEEDLLDEETYVLDVKAVPVKKSKRARRKVHVSNADHMKLCDELKLILSHTNALPFKSKVAQIHCAYCMERFPCSTQQLRAHCRATHANERIAAVDTLMHPYWCNEIVKLDIASLQCTVCNKVIPLWSDMLKHLHQHDASLELHYRMIPYHLGEDCRCALCSQTFPSFAALDYHMNSHYSNYVCGKCGNTYLTVQKLNTHIKIHETGKYPCKLCPKVFTHKKYIDKHVSVVHDKIPMYRCVECKNKFNKAKELKTHIDKEHESKSRTYECQKCDKVFQLKSYYLKHLRLKHSDTVRDKKFSCELCDKKFYFMYELNNHMKWHLDDDNLICTYCNMKLCNKSYLQKHMENKHSHRPL